MTSSEVRKKYLDFFVKKGHKIVPSASLIPENDPTTLFTSAGMQPMISYLLGEPHPEGKRITDSQKVFRAVDIEEVGDNRHTTLFEMLGNWSLGDYFKEDQINWIFEFQTEVLNIDPNKLYISVFIGDPKNDIPKDTEAAEIWKKVFSQKGIQAEEIELGSLDEASEKEIGAARIFYYDAEKNWWSRSGTPNQMPTGEPGGPSSEMFYLFDEIEHDLKYGQYCHPNCDCGRFLEIGNNVFMQYKKNEDDTFSKLPSNNVDYGGGLERLAAVSENQSDVFQTESFWPIIEKAQEQLGVLYAENEDHKKNFRIIADHIKAATFLIKAGVLPSNKLQGYVLRRLLRRAAIKINSLKENSMDVLPKLVDPVLDIYKDTEYFQTGDWDTIRQVIEDEISKFQKTIKQGLKEIEKLTHQGHALKATPLGKTAFDLYQSYGFPIELSTEIFREKGLEINMDEFQAEVEKHRALSQTTSAGMFKGGLADQTEQTTKLHTATHLLQAAAKQVLEKDVGQRGSHITMERLRWDFNYNQKLTEDQIKQIEDLVNQKIDEDLKVHFDIEERDEAIKSGATTNQGENYPDKVKVYKMGDFSKELCGGPHVENTGTLGQFKIIKEEGISTGVRRIYATVE